MAQPEIIKDIDARVKDTGDTMTGSLIMSGDDNYITINWINNQPENNTNHAIHFGASDRNHMDFFEYGAIWNFYKSREGVNTLIASIAENGITAPTFIGALDGNASSSTYTCFQDTRNVNEMPLDMLSGISLHLKSNSTDGLNDGLSYHPVLMLRDWHDLSGGPFAELAITGNQNLYFRSSTTNADNTWNPWRKVLTDYNYTSILNNTYLPLTGGTLTGALTINNTLTVNNARCSINYGVAQYCSNMANIKATQGLNICQGANETSGIQFNGDYIMMWSPADSYTIRYYDEDSGNEVWNINSSGVFSGTVKQVYLNGTTTSTLYLYGSTTTTAGNKDLYTNSSIYISGNVLYGAAWNDYAEYRSSDPIESGRVICETGNGTLKLSTERLQPGANVVSDTFGFAIGETENCKTPIAVSGRALVYTYEDRHSYEAGDPVCAGPGGTVSKMSREEVMMYPDRIVGTVSEIPEYERWGTGNVEVKNRIWIKVR